MRDLIDFMIEVANQAGHAGLDAELEFVHGLVQEPQRIAVTSPDEDEDRLVEFINAGPSNWDYELTTSRYTGVPVVLVGVNS